MISGFFDNKKVVSEDFATFVRGILTNGVTGDSEDVLKVTAAGGMNVSVAPGYAWINGHFGRVDTAETLTLSTASGSMTRIDRVVVRLDMSAGTVSLAVIKGTAAVSPSATPLTRDGTIYELCLANIRVSAGATAITDANIDDTRADKTICGAVLANTKESLTIEGLASKSELEELENSISADIAKLYARKLAVKNLISETVEGTIEGTATSSTATLTTLYSMAGHVSIQCRGKVTMKNPSDSTVEAQTSDYEFSLAGVGDSSEKTITLLYGSASGGDTITGNAAPWKAKLTASVTDSGITISAVVVSPEVSSTSNYRITAFTLESARAVHLE